MALSNINIQFQDHQYDTLHQSPFVGPPDENTEYAWESLFSSMSLRVTASELATHSLESVELPSGGHLAWLGIFHELHCIKVLRQINYQNFYHPNLTEAEMRDLQVHADHCIDQLRSAIMCLGDIGSLTTFIWDGKWRKPLLSPARPHHKCYSRETLVESLQDRVVGDEELGDMKNPLFA